MRLHYLILLLAPSTDLVSLAAAPRLAWAWITAHSANRLHRVWEMSGDTTALILTGKAYLGSAKSQETLKHSAASVPLEPGHSLAYFGRVLYYSHYLL